MPKSDVQLLEDRLAGRKNFAFTVGYFTGGQTWQILRWCLTIEMLSNRGLECKKKRNHKRIDTVIKIMLDALVAFYRTSIFYFYRRAIKK